MAVVLPSEESSYFGGSTLRRSHSQPKFSSHGSSYSTRPTPPQPRKIPHSYNHSSKPYDNSSPTSSPRTNSTSTDDSYSSTPASSFSLPCEYDDDSGALQLAVPPDDQFVLRPYTQHDEYRVEDLEAPTSPKTGDSYTVSPADADSHSTSRPQSPSYERAEDDTAVRPQPSRHVDYLSHNWKEEDIWSSWRYIVSRRGLVANGARLENASWRSWMKAKNCLRTVSPETLNW